MKKKLLNAFLGTALAGAVLTGCTSKTKPVDKLGADKPSAASAATEASPPATTVLDGEEPDQTESGKTIALSLPDDSSGRWVSDAANMKQGLEALGYHVLVQYAQDDPKQQAAQITDFVTAKADCIVIAPVDSKKLTDAETAAQAAGIPVIAYDDLLMDTDAVSFYATFDHKGIGNMIGMTIVEKADLDDLSDGEYRTAEFFMGPKDDNNSRYLYQGLMEVLQPYLDNGTLVCNTGRTSFDDTCIADWSQDKAAQRCENYLEGYYKEEDLNICVTASDVFAYVCEDAFMAAGYTEDNWPVISGVDCEALACKKILEGTQTFSVCKDTRILAEECVEMIDALMNGKEPDVNNAQLYDNNVMTVPAHMCSPYVVDADNLQELIIDGGYYTREEIDAAE